MNTQEMRRYLRLLGEELARNGVTGEIVLAGGAVMLLAIGSRDITRDIDAYFAVGTQQIREAARIIAERERLPPDWINDGVKGFFYTQPPTQLWQEYPGLRVYMASPEYVLAMKAVAGRPEDIADIHALATYLGLRSAEAILVVVQRYVPERLLLPKTRYLIESLFDDEHA
jgi:predicted nucleotidyltransferase